MEQSTANVVSSLIALLSVAATVLLALNAQTGIRRRVENIKLATETLEKTRDPEARRMISRFISRETSKLEDTMHPNTRAQRRYFMAGSILYLVAAGTFVAYLLLPSRDNLPAWILYVGAWLFLLASVVNLIAGLLATLQRSARTTAAQHALDRPFREDDARRQKAH